MNKTMIDVIRDHARNKYSQKAAVVYLEKRGVVPQVLSYSELDRKAGSLAAALHQYHSVNDYVILLFTTGIDFIVTYMACLYAGRIPIPVTPPDETQLTRTSAKLNAVLRDSHAKIILTNSTIKKMLQDNTIIENSDTVHVMDVNQFTAATDYFVHAKVNEDTMALIQYSSGTTGKPKGVTLSQRNLLYGLQHNSIFWEITTADKSLSRTPHYYIYGLVTGILLPLYNANSCFILSPTEVIKDPAFWLESISTYKITYSGCPNFGYQQCVDKMDRDVELPIALTHWRIAICGGERVQKSTLNDFYNKFKKNGFNQNSFCISYGLSEMTGFVSSTQVGKGSQLATHQSLISCGRLAQGTKIKIIRSGKMRAAEIGEICLSSPTLCQGYLNHAFSDNELIKDKQNGDVYFRTGDVGFMQEDELYLMSRCKDIIIIHGENFLPEDIEASIKQAHPLLSNSEVMATSIETHQEEKVLVMVEVDKELDRAIFSILINSIYQHVLHDCGLRLDHIIFVTTNTLPKTQSGKLQRLAAKEAYAAQQLAIIYEDKRSAAEVNASSFLSLLKITPASDRMVLIETQLHKLIKEILHIELPSIANLRLFDLGMTSLLAVEFRDRLQMVLEDKISVPASFIFEYPSISAMARYIENKYMESGISVEEVSM